MCYRNKDKKCLILRHTGRTGLGSGRIIALIAISYSYLFRSVAIRLRVTTLLNLYHPLFIVVSGYFAVVGPQCKCRWTIDINNITSLSDSHPFLARFSTLIRIISSVLLAFSSITLAMLFPFSPLVRCFNKPDCWSMIAKRWRLSSEKNC
jgi:hypothetical protein